MVNNERKTKMTDRIFQARKARSILMRLFGDITRDPQSIRNLTDDEAIAECRQAGYRWDMNRMQWVDVAIENAIDAGATANEIWGN
jgi:hypothetical protein